MGDGPRGSRVLAVAALTVAGVTAGVMVWNTQIHDARIALGWAVTSLVAAGATWRDLRTRPARPPMRAAFVVAALWLYFLGFLTVLVLVFGWIFSILGIVFGLPATALAWVARTRLAGGEPDGAALAAGMLLAAGCFALTRPWSASSHLWARGAAVAFAGVAVVVADTVRWAARRQRRHEPAVQVR